MELTNKLKEAVIEDFTSLTKNQLLEVVLFWDAESKKITCIKTTDTSIEDLFCLINSYCLRFTSTGYSELELVYTYFKKVEPNEEDHDPWYQHKYGFDWLFITKEKSAMPQEFLSQLLLLGF